jgi:hypothetical protein
MPLAGTQLSIKQALALCYAVGWRRFALTTAVAVMTAESGRYDGAWHLNDNGSTDRGLFQINTVHPLTDAEAFDAKRNAEYAFTLSRAGADWTPWAAYNSGAALKYVPIVAAVRLLHTWRTRVAHWLEDEA